MGADDKLRISAAYRQLYARAVTPRELQLGLQFLTASGAGDQAWTLYAQALLSSNELVFVD
jgi:hypothetical protein